MSPRRTAAAALAAAHLTLVAAGAFGWHPPALGPAGRALDDYGALSGASSRFDFFAPAVASPLRATFTTIDAAGRARACALEDGANREAQLRIASVVTCFYHAEYRPELRRALAASWAATVFGHHPAAERVVVRVEVDDLPTMAQYRAGWRPRWRPVYEAVFTR